MTQACQVVILQTATITITIKNIIFFSFEEYQQNV